MLNKKQRTIDRYIKVGAEARLLKTLSVQFCIDIASVITKRDLHRLNRAREIIGSVCSNAEDKMFADHPELDDAFNKVFCGCTDTEPVDDLDRRLNAQVLEIANKLVYTAPEADNDRS